MGARRGWLREQGPWLLAGVASWRIGLRRLALLAAHVEQRDADGRRPLPAGARAPSASNDCRRRASSPTSWSRTIPRTRLRRSGASWRRRASQVENGKLDRRRLACSRCSTATTIPSWRWSRGCAWRACRSRRASPTRRCKTLDARGCRRLCRRYRRGARRCAARQGRSRRRAQGLSAARAQPAPAHARRRTAGSEDQRAGALVSMLRRIA